MLHLLLPARRRLAALAADPRCRRALARADRLADAAPGYAAQACRQFGLIGERWPEAAFSRQHDCADATGSVWLRADPAYLRAEISGVRLLACGGLGLDDSDALAFAGDLEQACADRGLRFSAPAAERWYLRLGADLPLPDLPSLDEALGADIDDLLPAGGDGRFWRALLNEVQIVLHNHPRNAARAAAGRPVVNSLWPHGGGGLPGQVSCVAQRVQSADAALLGAGSLAGCVTGARAPHWEGGLSSASALIDLRDVPPDTLAADWLLPIWDALRRRWLDRCELDFADGVRRRWHSRSRLYFWRRSDPVTG